MNSRLSLPLHIPLASFVYTVEHAEAKREMLSQKLSNARKETAKIKTQLGEEESCSSGDEQVSVLCCKWFGEQHRRLDVCTCSCKGVQECSPTNAIM